MIPHEMKAAYYMGRENIEIRTVPVPQIHDHDVLIQNICSSICGTDSAVFMKGPNMGHKIDIGSEFGHETVSRVAAIGSAVTDFRIGDRVYPYPLFARNDTSRAGTLGGFSEYILCPEAKLNHSLYKIPDSITDRTACMIEPFTVGFHAARQADPSAKDTAIVYGAGTIGIAAAIALKFFGLKKVMITDLSKYRLDIAEGLGFETIQSGSQDFQEKLQAYFGSAASLHGNTADIDITIDAAGADSVFNEFMKHAKITARFVAVAVNNSIRNVDMLQMIYASQSLIGSGGYTPQEVHDVMDVMSKHKWNIESIITDEFCLNDLKKALYQASDTEHSLNVIINMRAE